MAGQTVRRMEEKQLEGHIGVEEAFRGVQTCNWSIWEGQPGCMEWNKRDTETQTMV